MRGMRLAGMAATASEEAVREQILLCLTVPDLREASQRAVRLGARVLDGPVDEGACIFQVHADPTGHPFCFCMDV